MNDAERPSVGLMLTSAGAFLGETWEPLLRFYGLDEWLFSFMKSLIRWNPKLYDLLSPFYDVIAGWFFPMAENGRRLALKGAESGRILDVACGTGALLLSVERLGLRGVGVDGSRGMLNQARGKLTKTFLIQGDFYALPFADESFDLVLETNAVSGSDIDSERVVAEMLCLCKRGREVRFVDYTPIADAGFVRRLLIKLGEVIGDQPFDYDDYCSCLGYAPEKQVLGWRGMYQMVRVKKEVSRGL